MRTLHTIVALAIVATLGYTQCTGGLFAISRAYAGSQTQSDEVMMSKALTECAVLLQSEDQGSGEEKTSSCDGKSCLQTTQALQGENTGILAGRATEIQVVAELPSVFEGIEQSTSLSLARAGPQYEDSFLVAYNIVKRE